MDAVSTPDRIRPANPDEGERLRAIAIAAKSYWGYDLDRVREWAAMGDFSPGGLRRKQIYVADVAGEAVGWAAAIDRGEVFWLEDLWIEPERMGQGVGRRAVLVGPGGVEQPDAGAVLRSPLSHRCPA